ncbi:MAG: CCA tRNA nucleotidyltransferase [Rhodospirillaceae bacterium]|nr:CCA tRNA nucleotidyltransferase [Rhodospirillaceae bacterium]
MTTSVSQVTLVPDATRSTGQLSPQTWMAAAETKTVIKALEAGGSAVRFVGGCVRDAMAHRTIKDIDIATPDPPDRVIRLLEDAGLKAVPTGIEHGTVTAVSDGQSFEVTTLRRDAETDGRHAVVEFTDDWLEDAKRRDFTFNAMSATPTGDVFDPYDGMADLAHGRVRFIGLATDRVREDYLRILRFFRFFGNYGRPPIDKNALVACRFNAEHLQELSGERIRSELLKILVVPDPADVAIRMRGERIFDHILPEAGDINSLRMINWLETRAVNIDGIAPEPIRHLAMLLDTETDAAGAEGVAKRLKLSNTDAARLIAIVGRSGEVSVDMGKADERRAIRRLGAEPVRDLTLAAWARELTDTPRLPRQRTQAYVGLLEQCAQWIPPRFPLKGSDVLALGVPQGPGVGDLLSEVEDWWENRDYKPGRQDCLNRLMKVIGNHPGED